MCGHAGGAGRGPHPCTRGFPRPLVSRGPCAHRVIVLTSSVLSCLNMGSLHLGVSAFLISAPCVLCVGSVGLCGCLSTYSTLSLEVFRLPSTRSAYHYMAATFLASQVAHMTARSSNECRSILVRVQMLQVGSFGSHSDAVPYTCWIHCVYLTNLVLSALLQAASLLILGLYQARG